MKVVIQIPCLNEEKTLPLVFSKMPKRIPAVDVVEYLIIDDGSTDRTVDTAKKLGVHHIVSHARTMGLARSFHDGVSRALELGADIVVNTDGDNQYPQERIPDLVQPIIEGKADIVIGDRETAKIAHFSPAKKLLQWFGSYIVSKAAGVNMPDAASGFRAYSRYSLLRLNLITKFSYTMETIIQAGNKNLAITSIPIKTNPKTRESRLFKSTWQHVRKSASAILRAYIMFKPYVIFIPLGVVFLVGGAIPFIRYAIFALHGHAGEHLQSLIIGVALLTGAFISLALAVIADLVRTSRILIEDNLERTKRLQFGSAKAAGQDSNNSRH